MKKVARKTFYSVICRVWGSDRPSEAWFDDRTAAEQFANHDYRDDVITHCVSRPESIEKCMDRVAITCHAQDFYAAMA